MKVTLQPGDYVATEGMTEDDYHAVAQAFMAAGANKGEYPNARYAFGTNLECFGVKLKDFSLYHGDKSGSAFDNGRELTVDQVLNAANARRWPEADMHITDKLCKARKERDEAQARYDQALAEHREAYPWLAIEERKQPADDMSDPANWRAGDFISSIGNHPDLTDGKLYQVLSMDSDNDPVIDDDADKGIARTASCFRFYHRPK